MYTPGLRTLQTGAVPVPRNIRAGVVATPPKMSTGTPQPASADTEPLVEHEESLLVPRVRVTVTPVHPADNACVRALPKESRLCIVNAAWELTVAAVNPLPVMVVLVAHSWAGFTTSE